MNLPQDMAPAASRPAQSRKPRVDMFMFIGLTHLSHRSPPSLNIAELAFYSAFL
jgi:hypothetical protein